MEYQKVLREAVIYSGIYFFLGFMTRGVGFALIAVVAAFFVIYVGHDLGKQYLKLTNQPALGRRFGLVMTPLYTFIIVFALCFAAFGGFHWLTATLAVFLAAIVFIFEYAGITKAVDGENQQP